MRKLFKVLCTFVALSLSSTAAISATPVTAITGAGATFPYPIYAKWAEAYQKQTGIGLNYQSIGSGGGIKQITAGTVDFGASDMPLREDKLLAGNLVQFPMVMGGVVPIYNVPGIASGAIKLDGATLANIFLGKIKMWNNQAIASLNPGVNLPATAITVVHRSDGSGTSFIFTNYLSKVSKAWQLGVGNDTAVDWPVGLGGKGNEGVAAYVQRTKGAIGYVEYAYALQNKIPFALLKNKSGNFVLPEGKSFQAAASSADWKNARGFYVILTDQPGKDSWPITGATFILMHKTQSKPATGLAALKFFDWAYANGDEMARSLDYVPMPNEVVALVNEVWKTKIKDAAKKPLWK